MAPRNPPECQCWGDKAVRFRHASSLSRRPDKLGAVRTFASTNRWSITIGSWHAPQTAGPLLDVTAVDARAARGRPRLQPGELCEHDGGGCRHERERGPPHDAGEFAVTVLPHQRAVGSDEHHQQ